MLLRILHEEYRMTVNACEVIIIKNFSNSFFNEQWATVKTF